MSSQKWVGQEIAPLEHSRFVTGRGSFIDDLQLPGLLYMAVLRSPYAHARLLKVDVSEALKLPGVVAALTGADLPGLCQPLKIDTLRPGMRQNDYPALPADKVRYAGEPIAVLAATSRYLAQDAMELVRVEYEVLPPVVSAEVALQEDAPLLYEEWGDNIAYSAKVSGGDLEQAFNEADGILPVKIYIPRLTAAALETRGAIASYNPYSRELTFWATNQSHQHLRSNLAEILGLPENRLRVIVPDMGGAFGSKHHVYPEDVLVALLSRKTNRPVKWIEERMESFQATDHAREQFHTLELAYKKDGTVTGLRGSYLADTGAKLPRAGAGPVAITTNSIPGPYQIGAYEMSVKMVVTNKTPLGGLRGYGSAQSTFVIERALDLLAAHLKLDPAYVRLINLVPANKMPYRSPSRMTYDSGDYPVTLKNLLEKIDYARLREEEARRQAAGELYGLGVCFFNKSSGLGPSAILAFTGQRGGYESCRASLGPDGQLTVYTGIISHGQNLETSLAQLCADELGLSPSLVKIVQGDSYATPYSPFGTSASRSLVVGGAAALKATALLREKILTIAAHQLEAAPTDLVLEEEKVSVKGAPARSVTLAQIAHTAYRGQKLPPGLEPGLEASASYDPAAFVYSFGAHVAAVKIDQESGELEIEKWWALHDCGTAVNPVIIYGQLQGGIAQGLGAALTEQLIYDDNGQLLSGSFMDYGLPTARDVPEVEIALQQTPSPVTPGGMRGIGEAGTVAALPVLASAVQRAFAPLGITEIGPPPYTPEKLWRLIHGDH
jgi:carbon-monoxide dehydrogenase large subunit